MAIIKWYEDKDKWLTFYHGAFENIKADLKNIITAINNTAAAVRMRCRRDKNLSDIYDAAEGRINLQLINDCSALPQAPHHHDSRYVPMIKKEESRASGEEAALWAALKKAQAKMDKMQDAMDDIKDTVDNNVTITIANNNTERWNSSGQTCVEHPGVPGGFSAIVFKRIVTSSANKQTKVEITQQLFRRIEIPRNIQRIRITGGCTSIPYIFNNGDNDVDGVNISSSSDNFSSRKLKTGYRYANGYSEFPEVPLGHIDFEATIEGPLSAGQVIIASIETSSYFWLNNFDKNKFQNQNLPPSQIVKILQGMSFSPPTSFRTPNIAGAWNVTFE